MTINLIVLTGAIGFLRFHRMVFDSTRHSAFVHFPSFSQRRYPSRNLEVNLQSTSGVKFFTNFYVMKNRITVYLYIHSRVV